MQRVKKYFLTLVLVFLSAFQTVYASDNYIPVRVGISNTNFNTYLFNSIEFISADSLIVMDSATGYTVGENPDAKIIKVTSENNLFRIYIDGELVAKNLTGPIMIRSKDNGLISVKDLKRKGRQAMYRGYIELIISSKDISKFSIVNILSLLIMICK